MQSWGHTNEQLIQKLIVAAVHLGRLTTNPLNDPSQNEARASVDALKAALRARLDGIGKTPFTRKAVLRPILNSNGYVEPLNYEERAEDNVRSIPRDRRSVGIIRRTEKKMVHDFMYHGDGHWSVAFEPGGRRYPAEAFESVPIRELEEAQPARKAARAA